MRNSRKQSYFALNNLMVIEISHFRRQEINADVCRVRSPIAVCIRSHSHMRSALTHAQPHVWLTNSMNYIGTKHNLFFGAKPHIAVMLPPPSPPTTKRYYTTTTTIHIISAKKFPNECRRLEWCFPKFLVSSYYLLNSCYRLSMTCALDVRPNVFWEKNRPLSKTTLWLKRCVQCQPKKVRRRTENKLNAEKSMRGTRIDLWDPFIL